MKTNELKAFMAQYDDEDKDPKQYLINMIEDYGARHREFYNASDPLCSEYNKEAASQYWEDRKDRMDKIKTFIDIMMADGIETSYTVMWVVKEKDYAFSERDWKRGFKTLDEAKEFALAKSKKKSFLIEDENDNPEEVFADFKHFRIFREKNCVINGERKLIEKLQVSRLIKSTGEFVNEELDEAA